MTQDEMQQALHEDLMRDSREYCCYCGTERHRVGCCGENHFQTYAEMEDEDQQAMLEAEYELLTKE